MSQSYCTLLYHIVFSTKHREPWLSAPIAARVHEYLGGIIRDEGGGQLSSMVSMTMFICL